MERGRAVRVAEAPNPGSGEGVARCQVRKE